MVQPTALEALADVNASPAGALALAPRLRTGHESRAYQNLEAPSATMAPVAITAT